MRCFSTSCSVSPNPYLLASLRQAPAGTVFYKVQLSKPLAPKQTVSLAVSQVFTRTLRPHPPDIAQGETQLVLYTDSLYPFSAYKTTGEVSTQLKLASDNIAAHTKKGVRVRGMYCCCVCACACSSVRRWLASLS
jgi:hypothetical protein